MVGEFAQIVGLLAAFSSGRKLDQSVDISEFLQWLIEHNHEDLKQLIENNQATAVSLKALLNSGLDNISDKLNQISSQLAKLGMGVEGVDELARLYSNDLLSEQALDILGAMENEGAKVLRIGKPGNVISSYHAGPILLMSPGNFNYFPADTAFLEDDLSMLATLGLLKYEKDPIRGDVYRYTKSAADLVHSHQPLVSFDIEKGERSEAVEEYEYSLFVYVTNNGLRHYKNGHITITYPISLKNVFDTTCSHSCSFDVLSPGKRSKIFEIPYSVIKKKWFKCKVTARIQIAGRLPLESKWLVRELSEL